MLSWCILKQFWIENQSKNHLKCIANQWYALQWKSSKNLIKYSVFEWTGHQRICKNWSTFTSNLSWYRYSFRHPFFSEFGSKYNSVKGLRAGQQTACSFLKNRSWIFKEIASSLYECISAQDASKTPPRRLQDASKTSQDASKAGQRCLNTLPRPVRTV